MNELNINQMEQIEGGGWGNWACIAPAATVTVATANPLAGMGTNMVCQLFFPEEAY